MFRAIRRWLRYAIVLLNRVVEACRSFVLLTIILTIAMVVYVSMRKAQIKQQDIREET